MSCKLGTFQTPVVIRSKYLKKWPCHGWTSKEWASACQGVKFPFRVHPIEGKNAQIQWENQACANFEATLDEFFQWNDNSAAKDNPFAKFPKKDFWAYSSYNYINQLFSDRQNLLRIAQWEDLDLGIDLENDATNSTIWIGNKHSYTPCHLDTYGFNLVAQILGKKMWVLFPKEDQPSLYPTRIPYEESSIFSFVNVLNPDFAEHPQFANCHPHVVIVEPGDILYVPKHWWHFVQCLEDEDGCCISINTWRPLNDVQSLFSESIVRFLTSVLFTPFLNGKEWINDRADLFSPSEALGYVRLLAQQCVNDVAQGYQDDSDSESGPQTVPESWSVLKVTTMDTLSRHLNWKEAKSEKPSSKVLEDRDVVRCILDPDVVSLISLKILSTVKQ